MTGPRESTWTGAGAPADFYGNPNRMCLHLDVEVFYSAADTDQELAKSACRRCPFQQACLTYALDRGEEHGVWGGVLMSSPDERRGAQARLRWQAATVEERQRSTAHLNTPSRTQRKKELEEQVRALWEQGKDDGTIALNIGITHGAVAQIRRRLKLQALYGPGGRRITQPDASTAPASTNDGASAPMRAASFGYATEQGVAA